MAEPTDHPADEAGATRDVPARLTRLEEHAAFAAHETEQLSDHLRALMAQLETVARRVEAIEARLRRAEAAEAAGDDVDA